MDEKYIPGSKHFPEIMNRAKAFFRQKGLRILLLGALAYFTCLMLLITLQYIPADTVAAFLGIKQDEIALPYYRIAFFTHVYTSIFTLLAGFIQFSALIRRQFPVLHKVAGRIYVLIILLFSAPSGLIMGIHANGGLISQLAFTLLSLLWFYYTAMALIRARQHKLKAHRAYMWRSFALTLSAITLRLWKWIIVMAFEPPPMDVYRIVAWLGWVGNLLIAELYLRSTGGSVGENA